MKKFLMLVLVALPGMAGAVDVVTDRENAKCEEFVAYRELRVFKDPTLFLPNLSLILEDPKVGWYRLMQETPLLTSLRGRVNLMRLGEPREFKNFGAIARLYEAAEPRLRMQERSQADKPSPTRIIPVQICGEGSLGFVLESDLKQASQDEEKALDGVLPPSTYPNPIPRWKDFKSRDATK